MLMRSTNTLFSILLICLLLIIQGCGVPGPAGNTSPTTETPSTLIQTTIPLRIIANEQIAGRELPKDGLNEIDFISPSRISLVVLDENFEEAEGAVIPNHSIIRGEDNAIPTSNTYEIQFVEEYSGQLDIVVKVTFSTGTELYAPLDNLENTNIPTVDITVFSHYIIQTLFTDMISTSEELEGLINCSSIECSEQYALKMDLINNINATIQDYDIEIANDATLEQIIEQFDESLDFRTHVENALSEITRTINPIHQGTERTIDNTDPNAQECRNYARDYHSVMFSLMLNDLLPDDGKPEVKFGRMITANEDYPAEPESYSAYPILQQTTFNYEVRSEGVTLKANTVQDSLSMFPDQTLELDTSDPVRKLLGSSSDTYLSTDGYLLYDRTYPADPNSPPTPSDNVERFNNPTYSKLYKPNNYLCETTPDTYNDEPTWLIGSNLGTGTDYELEISGSSLVLDDDGNEVRTTNLENKNIFSWEVHGTEIDTEVEPVFDEDQLLGKEYGALSFSVDLNDTGEAIKVYAETLFWDKSGANIIENQPNDHYMTYSLGRNADRSAIALAEFSAPLLNTQRALYLIDTQKLEDTETHNYGVVGLDGGSRPSHGHVTQNGKHLAFSLNSFDKGQGIIIATELRENGDLPSFITDATEFEYQIMGNIVTFSDTHNSMFNLNNSELTLTRSDTDICVATLSLNQRGLEHTLSDNTLSDQFTRPVTTVTSSACQVDNDSEIELSFDDVNGLPLRLKGFVSQQSSETDGTPGTFIPMIWIQDDTLGLIFANLNQTLSEGFN